MAYRSDQFLDDRYCSDYTANMQNTEGMYVLPPKFNANSTEFDTTASINSNGEMDGVPSQYDLNINAAAVLKSKGILCNNQKGRRSPRPPRVLTKSSEIPAGAVAKMMTNKQDRVVNKQGNHKILNICCNYDQHRLFTL